MSQIRCKLELTKLDSLKVAGQKRIYKKAVRAGLKPIINTLRSIVPVRTGALKKALSSKVDAKKDNNRVFGLVGPRSKWEKVVKGVTKKPSKYAHFANKIHKFMERAAALLPNSARIMNDVIATEFQKELSK